jgi:hypothetical protein
VLFSNADVAGLINRFFEPAWEMVRPVPLIRIDFGNNQVVTRTLHGNIATYVCTAEGEVLDILPGIYTPKAYQDCLNQFRLLANYVDQGGKAKRSVRARQYHDSQAAELKKNGMAHVFINTAGMAKRAIEGGVRAVLVPANQAGQAQPREKGRPPAKVATAEKPPPLTTSEDLASWTLLHEDTRLNETLRRRLIHEMLAQDELVRPAQVVQRVYKEALHCDLDDPYLGLGPALFANYPFAKEEKSR